MKETCRKEELPFKGIEDSVDSSHGGDVLLVGPSEAAPIQFDFFEA